MLGPPRGRACPAPALPVFDDISHLLPDNHRALHYGAAVCEPFGAGRRALAVAGFLGPNRLLSFDGRRLVDEADEDFADVARQAIGMAAGDSDGDGCEELYVVNTDRFSGPKRLADRWFDLADGLWRDLFELPHNRGAANYFAGRSAGAVDREGNGRYAFCVANHGGPLRLYRSQGEDEVFDLAPSLGLARVAQARTVLVGPLLSTGSDLLIGTENGPNLLFVAEPGGGYREVASIAGVADPRGACRGGAAFDAGAGALGLVLAGWQTPNRCFVPELPGVTFRDRTPLDLGAPGRVRTAVVADFDNDGHEELFLNRMGEANRLFRRHGDGWHELSPGAALLAGGFGTGAVVADIDGDGCLELLVCHGEEEPQPLALFRARRREHGWIRFAPRTRSGAPARGALVQLFTDDGLMTRLVCGGSGYLCQQEPVAHFGLGTARIARAAQVRWPDGCTALIPWPEAGREHTVPHPTTP